MKEMKRFVKHWLTPRRSNNFRPKVLHPIGMAAVAGLFLLLDISIKLIAKLPLEHTGFVLGYASSISVDDIVSLTNQERANLSLPALTINQALSNAAAAKAAHMFANDYWAHIAPDGTSPWFFIKNAGYGYSVAGENLARDFGDSSGVVSAWMRSPTHRDNIIHTKYKEIGVAVVNGKLGGVETTLVVQMFGARNGSVAATPAKPVPAVNPNQQPSINELEIVKQTSDTGNEPANQPVAVNLLPGGNDTNSKVNGLANQSRVIISPLMIMRGFGVAVVSMMLTAVMLDWMGDRKRGIKRSVGNNLAHAGLMILLLISIMALSQGVII